MWIKLTFVFALIAMLLFIGGCSTLRNAKPWHRIDLTQEYSAKNFLQKDDDQWRDYLAQEDKLFSELVEKLADADTTDGYRYEKNSPLNPLLQTPNWNRTFVLTPNTIRGGIVMLHGLTDSPYSVRSLAQSLEKQGFLVIALRTPGHGTLPSGLLSARWPDWVAATRLAAQEVKRQLGDNPNFYLLGYSNGGTLALNYTLDAMLDKDLPTPKKVILLSPMIGISEFAGLSKPLEIIGHLPLLSSNRWLSKSPEYNPFKYNSFPVNAAWQAHRFSLQLQFKILKMAKLHQLKDLPPILTFQSLMDATVKTDALEKHLYRHLPENNSELVLFDINRHHSFVPITRPTATNFMRNTFAAGPHPYHLVKIGNRDAMTMEVSERRQSAGTLDEVERPLDLAFPSGVFSLSHVALPFPVDDPMYGLTPRQDEFFGIRLGSLHLRGESNTLIIKADADMRLYSNPFYPYMQERIFEWLDVPLTVSPDTHASTTGN